MMQATYPGGTHAETARELASIFNMLYASPLYPSGLSHLTREIIYPENGQYRNIEE